jgi:hypothetical protein
LEARGAAAEWRSFASPVTGADAARAFLLSLAHRALSEKPVIEVDLLNREALRRDPGMVWPAWSGQQTLADVIDPIVVEPDGAVVPFSYGIHRRHALGWLQEVRLTNSIEEISDRVGGLVSSAIAAALEEEWPYLNWYEKLVEQSWAEPATAREDYRQQRVHGEVAEEPAHWRLSANQPRALCHQTRPSLAQQTK